MRTFIAVWLKIFGRCGALSSLNQKKAIWRWSDGEENAFTKLKNIFSTEPVLAQWNPDRETVVEADCSGYALGAFLSQFDSEGKLRPVAYYSRRLSGADINYPIHDKEMLSIVCDFGNGKQSYSRSQNHSPF